MPADPLERARLPPDAWETHARKISSYHGFLQNASQISLHDFVPAATRTLHACLAPGGSDWQRNFAATPESQAA
jgi:hypothetical protein